MFLLSDSWVTDIAMDFDKIHQFCFSFHESFSYLPPENSKAY